MKTGLLYTETDQKKVKSEIEKGAASAGIDVESLFDFINFCELQHEYNHTHVVAELKKQLMLISGRLTVQPEEETKEVKKDGIQG